MRTGLTDRKRPPIFGLTRKTRFIHIRTHNTDLKKRMLAYSRRYLRTG